MKRSRTRAAINEEISKTPTNVREMGMQNLPEASWTRWTPLPWPRAKAALYGAKERST